jgi:nucleotide-binding universal stress UspA family protein
MYERILFPTDGSEGAEAALEHAIDHAVTYDAALHVLYVVEENVPVLEAGDVTLLDALEAEGERILEAASERATAAGVGTVQATVGGGSPYRTILEYAEDNDIDLIVMGTHGRTGLGHYLLGSTTEKVVRLADVEVLTSQTVEPQM